MALFDEQCTESWVGPFCNSYDVETWESPYEAWQHAAPSGSGSQTPDVAWLWGTQTQTGYDSAPNTPPFCALRILDETPMQVPLHALSSKLQELGDNACTTDAVGMRFYDAALPPAATQSEALLLWDLPPGLGAAAEAVQASPFSGLSAAAAVFVPPPPEPHPTSFLSPLEGLGDVAVSLGSLGHPGRCAEACPYVKRKSGCKMGASCRKCHLCFWQRPTVKTAEQEGRRPRACELDDAPRARALTATSAASTATTLHQPSVCSPLGGFDAACYGFPDEEGISDAGLASVGSIGHPHACGKPCKYESKGKGCKDGRWCVRCHICHWRRIDG